MNIHDVFLVEEGNPHALSLAKKLMSDAKPGAIIFVTQDELSAFDAIRVISTKNKPTAEQSPE